MTLDIYTDQVTIEHCSVLLERLGDILDEAYPDENLANIASEHMDPVRMKLELLDMFTPSALSTLFQTEMGKGVIIGAFVQKHIFSEEIEE